MADNRLRLLVFREWENGRPKVNAKVYDVECLVDEIPSHREEGERNGYELEAVMIEGSEGWY